MPTTRHILTYLSKLYDPALSSCRLEFGQALAKELYTAKLDSMLTPLPVEAIFSSQARKIVLRRVGCNGATASNAFLIENNQFESQQYRNGANPSNSFDFVFCVASHRYDIGLFAQFFRYREAKLGMLLLVWCRGTKAQYYVRKGKL